MTLTDFLLARIAEDEARAQELLRDLEAQIAESGFEADERGAFTPTRQLAAEMWAHYAGQTRRRNFARGQAIARFADPARVLAECEAKRRIVEEVLPTHPDYDPLYIQRLLALPYADHPDYDEAWRP